MPSRIQLRRGTAAQWTTANPLLSTGEVGLETDTKRRKTGDGSTLWNALPYDFDNTVASGAYVPFVEVVNTVAASGAAQSLPLPSVATMNDITLTANCTLTLPTPTKGGFVVLLRQDATGSRVPSWSGSVIWDGNAAPTQSSGAGTATEYVFESFSGTNWRGKFGGSYPS